MDPTLRRGVQSIFSDEKRKRVRGLFDWKVHLEAPGTATIQGWYAVTILVVPVRLPDTAVSVAIIFIPDALSLCISAAIRCPPARKNNPGYSRATPLPASDEDVHMVIKSDRLPADTALRSDEPGDAIPAGYQLKERRQH